ncbi:MAG: YdeI/OmpD-associated family protein, partial [Bryobacteraceae bacterium]
QRFRTTIDGSEKGRVYLVIPFDPAAVWGPRPRYHVAGTVNDGGIRGALVEFSKGYFLPLGPAWRRCSGLKPGDTVSVMLAAEGPQRDALAPDLAAALEASPAAGAFFDSLASFYRKNYLRWIDATKRRPDVRAARIRELVELLKAGQKQRPH